MREFHTQKHLRILFYFLLSNYILSLIIAYPYLSYGPTTEDLPAWVYTRVAFLSTFAIFMIIFWFLLYIVTRLIKSTVQLFVLPPLVLIVFQVLLLIDVQIYKIFRFHINGLVINTLVTEGAGDSVQIGRSTVFTFVIFLIILLVIEWGSMWGIARYTSRRPEKVIRYSLYKIAAFILPLFLSVTILSDKLIFAYANFHELTHITRYQKLFPLYQPLFMDETLEKYLGWKKNQSPAPMTYQTGTMLNYPIEEPDISGSIKKWNIVWITIESWRFDMMNRDVTPHIYDFSRRAVVFNNHYSGGNATRFGIFPMFYGIYGTYWHQFLAERRSPVFMDTMMKLGYDFRILSSTRLTYPEMRSTAFVKVPEQSIEDHIPGEAGNERDTKMEELFRNYLIERDKSRPFFSFMFLDSPHAPYRFPKDFEKYKPVVEEVNYFQMKKSGTQVNRNHPLFNRYRNAIFFDDSVVDRIIRDIEDAGLLDNTIILITGDHGEEFFETGYYGHNTTFSSWQAQVPLILYVPGIRPHTVDRLTSHLDLAPTMLSLTGISTDPSLYSQGMSLFEDKEHPYVVVSGWDTFAIVDKDSAVVLSTESYNAGMAEVYTGNYGLADDSKAILKTKMGQLTEVTKKLGYFLK